MKKTDNYVNIIAQRIKDMRLEKNWTQKDLAQKVGLKNETAIANYEAGYSTPKDEIKFKMCEVLECSMDYLMGKSDIRTPIDINDVQFANNGGINTEGLDPEDVDEIQKQVEYMRWKKEQEKKEKK